MKKPNGLVKQVKQFLFVDMWQMGRFGNSPVRKFLVKQVKVFFITYKGFMDNKVSIRASALTMFTLMSVVPIVAMAFGIAKGFGMDKMLQEQLTEKLSGHQDVLNYIISFANSMLERTKGGVVAGVGLAVLFWSVMRVLGNIEAAFNDIWQVKKGRTFFRKFSDYLSIMLIAPIFMILSSSVTVYITTQITSIVQSISVLGFFSPVIRVFINLIPYVLIWALFSFIYVVMPNTSVKVKPAIISGIVAGTVFQIVQWAYFKFQISVSSYNAIYGSFAALPLFMIWLQTAWLIVLFGAEMSYATQNVEKFEFENESKQISPLYRKTLSLLVTNYIVKRFARGEPAPEIDEISSDLSMPSRIVRDIIHSLVEAGVLSQVVIGYDNHETYYQPAVDINILTIKSVLDRLNNVGTSVLSIAQVAEMDIINQRVKGFSEELNQSGNNVLLKDI